MCFGIRNPGRRLPLSRDSRSGLASFALLGLRCLDSHSRGKHLIELIQQLGQLLAEELVGFAQTAVLVKR